MKSLAMFRNSMFRYFFFASMIGLFGEGIFSLTSLVMLQKHTHSVTNIGYMLVLTMLPSVFLAPFGGVWIDKYNKAMIAIFMNIARFVMIVAVPVLAFFGVFRIEVLYGSIFFSYIVWYMLTPTSESMLKEVLTEDQYVQGVSFIQAAWQVGLFTSALVAGTLMKYFGTNVTLWVASCTYLLGGALYFRIKSLYQAPSKQQAAQTDVKQYVRDIGRGWAYLFANKKIFWFSLAACLSSPFFSAINILLAPFNYQVLRGNEVTLGAIDSAAGIGSLFSVAFCVWIAKRRGIPWYLSASLFLLSASTFLYSLSHTFFVAYAMYLLIGVFVGNLKVLSKSLVYQHVQQSYIGRTMSTISMLSLAMAIGTSLLIGYLGQYSLLLAYKVVAVALLLGILFVWIGASYARMERSSARQTEFQNETGV